VPDLIAALKDTDALVVPQAVWALGQIGPAAAEALPALQKMHEARRHRGIVADAMRRIRGEAR
jgi:HEAT repeat protein